MTLRQDLIVDQYADWSFVYTHKDGTGAVVDLTGYSAAMSIKRQPGQTAVARSYLSTGADADGGTITLGGSAGTVMLTMTAQQTKQLLWDFDLWALIETGRADAVIKPESHLVYDLALTDAAGKATRAIEGRVIVRRSVTP